MLSIGGLKSIAASRAAGSTFTVGGVLTLAGTATGTLSTNVDSNFLYVSTAGQVGVRILGATTGIGLHVDNGSIVSAVAAASNAVMFNNAGARLKFSSAGASDYLIGDGSTTVQSAADFSVGASAGAVRANLFMKVGTGSALAKAHGTIDVNSTGVGNIGASGPDDLQTYSLPANSLDQTGRGIRVVAYGTTASNANAKTVRLVFGGTTLVTKQLTASVAGTWKIEATVLRTGASAQDYYAEAYNNNGSTVASADGATVLKQAAFGTATETDTGAIVIKTQSTVSTADNDIVSQGLIVEFI